jgi:Rieske Fe-S protein
MSGETLDRSVGRRTVLGGAALVAAGAAVSACAGTATPAAQPSSTVKATAIGNMPAPTGAADAGIGNVKDVPVGGGLIVDAKKVVVTQPAAGTFKAFSAVCTHQGCTVSAVSASGIACPCHGSVFSIDDGSVVNGPATKPLTPMKVTVDNGTLEVS